MAPLTSPVPIDLDNVRCGLMTCDEDGHVRYANATLSEMLGLPLHTMLSLKLTDLLPPGARVYHQMVLQPMLRLDGHIDEISLILRAADGREIHVLAQAARRLSGTAALTDWALMPVSERKRLQDKLLHARRAVDQMPGVLFRMVGEPDDRHHMPYVSSGITDMTGLDPGDLFDDATPLFELVHPADRDNLRLGLALSRSTLRTQPITVRLMTPERGQRWVRIHARVHAQADQCVVWQGAIYDVTQQQQIDERLRDMDKLQAIATLASGVAHDFNNLLGSITGLTELCQLAAANDPRQLRNLERIGLAAQKATGLVRQLLDFSRQTPQQKEIVSLAGLVERASPLLAATLPPNIQLAIKIENDCCVSLDSAQIEQCLMNLVNNAAHALRLHGGHIQIVADLHDAPLEPGRPAAVKPRRPMARLRIIDDGEGIAPELHKKIFEPFFTTKPVGVGTGLGLSAVHGIVTSHGGLVTVDSKPGEGTTFHLYLPRATPASPAACPSTPLPGNAL